VGIGSRSINHIVASSSRCSPVLPRPGRSRRAQQTAMPVIWLLGGGVGEFVNDEPTNPRDLMRPFPAGLMRMWPISTRVNKPENDDPSIVGADRADAGCGLA
jgi:hypothetical protein